MTARRIVQVRAKDFRTALYVRDDDDTDRYLVSTDTLCPDCTTPVILLAGLPGGGVLRTYHDPGCVMARRRGGEVLSADDCALVAWVRRRFLEDALEVWTELG